MRITNIYTIYGAEPFLIELKRDEIIKDLKNKDFFIREIFFNNDSSFKLENLLKENESSLFSEKKILDLRLNSSITKENTEKFLDFCKQLFHHILLIGYFYYSNFSSSELKYQ